MIASMNWSNNVMNVDIIRDYLTNAYSRFSQDSKILHFEFSLDSKKQQVIEDIIWIVKGIVELTSSRYHHGISLQSLLSIEFSTLALLLLTQLKCSKQETLLMILRLFSTDEQHLQDVDVPKYKDEILLLRHPDYLLPRHIALFSSVRNRGSLRIHHMLRLLMKFIIDLI